MKTNQKVILTLAMALTVWQPVSAFAETTATHQEISNVDVAHSGTIWGNSLDYIKYDTKDASCYTDFCNAPSSYGIVGGDKEKNQELGTINGTNDGVLWSEDGSDFGSTANLVINQDITFKFLFWQADNNFHALN